MSVTCAFFASYVATLSMNGLELNSGGRAKWGSVRFLRSSKSTPLGITRTRFLARGARRITSAASAEEKETTTSARASRWRRKVRSHRPPEDVAALTSPPWTEITAAPLQRPNTLSRIQNEADDPGKWQKSDAARLKRLRDLLVRSLDDIGLGPLVFSEEAAPNPDSHHHLGVTRMSCDPPNGVTDQYGRVFGTENLFVTCPSLFPSGGRANPTLTSIALTIRLADEFSA